MEEGNLYRVNACSIEEDEDYTDPQMKCGTDVNPIKSSANLFESGLHGARTAQQSEILQHHSDSGTPASCGAAACVLILRLSWSRWQP